MTHRTLIRTSLVALAALLVGSLFIAAMVAVASAMWTHIQAHRRRRHTARARLRALPQALDALAVATEAGLTPHQTIGVLTTNAPPALRPTFADIATLLDRGVGFADAIVELPAAVGPAAAPAADALAIAHRHGTPLSDTVNLLAADAARQRQLQASAAARRLPVLLSFPLVVCVLPAFALIAIAPAVIGAARSLSAPGW